MQWCHNFSLTTAAWEDGGPLQIACFFVGTDTSSGAICATMVPEPKKMDMPHVDAGTAKWETKEEFFGCCWTKWQKNVVLEEQDWQINCHVSPTQSHQSNGVAEKAVCTVRGLLRTCLAVIKDKVSFDVTTRSPMLPWTIRHAAWVLPRYNVRRDDTVQKIRGQKYRKEILPLGKQVLARRPGANVYQLLQPWVTGFLLGRDTLSDEHLVGTADGVMRNRAVRRLQEPARWVPEVLQGMRFAPRVCRI